MLKIIAAFGSILGVTIAVFVYVYVMDSASSILGT